MPQAGAIVYQDASAEALAGANRAKSLPRIAVAVPGATDLDFARIVDTKEADAAPRPVPRRGR